MTAKTFFYVTYVEPKCSSLEISTFVLNVPTSSENEKREGKHWMYINP